MSHAWMLGIEQQQRIKLPATLARQHTLAYVSIRQHMNESCLDAWCLATAARQAPRHTCPSAYVSIRQHTSAYE
jgi:hypothetical protein